MRFRKPILVTLAIAEVLLIGYSAVSIAQSFDQKELGWGDVWSLDIPAMQAGIVIEKPNNALLASLSERVDQVSTGNASSINHSRTRPELGLDR